MEERKSILLPTDFIHTVEKLSHEQAGQLLNLLLEHGEYDSCNHDKFGPVVSIAFTIISPSIKKGPRFWEQSSQEKHRIIRSERLLSARSKGTHSKEEWHNLRAFFNETCGKCLGESGVVGVEKDHIIPLHKNGSDSIQNIQPLCSKCNRSDKYDENDYRPTLALSLGKVLPDLYKNPY